MTIIEDIEGIARSADLELYIHVCTAVYMYTGAGSFQHCTALLDGLLTALMFSSILDLPPSVCRLQHRQVGRGGGGEPGNEAILVWPSSVRYIYTKFPLVQTKTVAF